MRKAFIGTIVLLSQALASTLSAQLKTTSTLDVLKAFQPGWEWTYRLMRTGTPSGFFSDTTSTFTGFSGSLMVRVDSIKDDSTMGVRRFHLKERTTGTEYVTNGLRVISTREIDSVTFSAIEENFTLSFRAGEHRIRGWLFADSLWFQSVRCGGPDSSTIFYPYLHYYRFYELAYADTFDVRSDTLVLTSQFTDCLDNGYLLDFRILPDSGIVRYEERLFNFFDWSWSNTLESLGSRIVTVRPDAQTPLSFVLHQNYPNPFNPPTTIRYELPARTHVALKIFNVLGEEVATLVDEEKYAGKYEVMWNAGRSASGVYIYQFAVGTKVLASKMVLLK